MYCNGSVREMYDCTSIKTYFHTDFCGWPYSLLACVCVVLCTISLKQIYNFMQYNMFIFPVPCSKAHWDKVRHIQSFVSAVF